MPELSVLMPVRNAQGTVRLAITSTLRAMPRDAELVVLDDVSIDDTPAVLASIDDRRLRVVSPGDSLGVARGLNYLLASSDSRYVARMDADDVTLPTRFRHQIRAIRAGNDAVFSQVVNWTPSQRTARPQLPKGIPSSSFGFRLLLSNPVSHPTMTATRSALLGVGGYRVVPSEDYDLWVRMAATGLKQTRLARWALAYRLHPEQITASASWRSASWSDPELAEAFADLSDHLVGQRLRRLVSVGSDPNLDCQQRDEVLAAFRAAFTSAVVAADLGWQETTILRRKLDSRLTAVREMASKQS